MRSFYLAVAGIFFATLPAQADTVYMARCADGPGLQFNFYQDGVAGLLYIKTPTGIVQLASYHRLIHDQNELCYAGSDVGKADPTTAMLCLVKPSNGDRTLAVQIGPVFTPSAVNTICKVTTTYK